MCFCVRHVPPIDQAGFFAVCDRRKAVSGYARKRRTEDALSLHSMRFSIKV